MAPRKSVTPGCEGHEIVPPLTVIEGGAFPHDAAPEIETSLVDHCSPLAPSVATP
jgi:hypothetical protein